MLVTVYLIDFLIDCDPKKYFQMFRLKIVPMKYPFALPRPRAEMLSSVIHLPWKAMHWHRIHQANSKLIYQEVFFVVYLLS